MIPTFITLLSTLKNYISQKKSQNLPWDTLEYDYLLKDLHANIWDENGSLLKPEDID